MDPKKLSGRSAELRESQSEDIPSILHVHREAFGGEQGFDISRLVSDLLKDASAAPRLSLIAIEGDEVVGHILFSHARIAGSDDRIRTTILAPLAVVPGRQAQGIGGRLIAEGLSLVSKTGVDLVFVLGHPGYYPRHGFIRACPQGFIPPFQPPGTPNDAWMVQELSPGVIGSVEGRILCADTLNELRHWRE
jgi:predicted N-acetyltransferase YhbS